MVAPVGGMVFNLDAAGIPQAQGFDTAVNFGGDMSVTVTGVPPGTTAATVAALIISSPLAIPLGFKAKRWQIPYSSLGSACTAVAF